MQTLSVRESFFPRAFPPENEIYDRRLRIGWNSGLKKETQVRNKTNSVREFSPHQARLTILTK